MLIYAREKAAKACLNNIEFHCVDGETLKFPPDTYDVVTIRWGLMFMPEPDACLASAYAAMKTDGRITLACWATPGENPFLGLLVQTLGKYMEIPKPPPGTPGIFAFADPERLRNIIVSASFRNVELEKIEFDFIEIESGLAYWEAISDLAAPIMVLVNQLDDEIRASFVNDVITTADALKQGDTLRLRGTTWLASADK
jgi:SAM-dependent methyltransferase